MNDSLIQQLDMLISRLQNTNKSKVADYFISLRSDLLSKEQDIENDALLRLLSSSAISQYASFSYDEDTIFSDIHALCSEEVTQRNLR